MLKQETIEQARQFLANFAKDQVESCSYNTHLEKLANEVITNIMTELGYTLEEE